MSFVQHALLLLSLCVSRSQQVNAISHTLVDTFSSGNDISCRCKGTAEWWLFLNESLEVVVDYHQTMFPKCIADLIQHVIEVVRV